MLTTQSFLLNSIEIHCYHQNYYFNKVWVKDLGQRQTYSDMNKRLKLYDFAKDSTLNLNLAIDETSVAKILYIVTFIDF